MNIDKLIEQLINLKSKGAETVEVLDENWNDYKITHLFTDVPGKRAYISVLAQEEAPKEKNDLPYPPSKVS